MSGRRDALDVFYPIVPDSAWVARLVPLGLRLVQLRLKGASRAEILRQVGESMATSARHGCRLVVNDHWREAIDLGAEFVHLGQGDLAAADLCAIRAAGIRLGVSTHDEKELDTALAAAPAYVALGPIYETQLKAMPCAPQGFERIGAWRRHVGALGLVAIGGLTMERASLALAAGADSAAVVTDIMAHADPMARVREWVSWRAAVGRARGQ